MNRHVTTFLRQATAVVAMAAIIGAPQLALATPITLLAWDATGLSGTTADPWAATTVATNMQTSSVNRGSGLTATSLSNGFAASGWNGPTDLAGAATANNYFQFTAGPSPTYAMSLDNIFLNFRTTSTGPMAIQFQYSFDGFSTAGTSIQAPINRTSPGSGTQTDNYEVDLSGIGALQNATGDVTFRLFGWNSSGSAGTAAFGQATGNNLELNGTVSSAGPPTDVLFWNGASGWTTDGPGTGGSGEWQNDWTPTDTATFGGDSGIVTIAAGGVSAERGIVFDVDGYSVIGNTLTFGATVNTIGVAPASTAIINAPIAGSNGLTKTDSGTLLLSGANTFSGNVTVAGGTLRIAADSALGDASNDLIVNGTLETTANVSLGAGRDVSGAGTLDIAPGTTLTVNGDTSMTALTLVNGGTLALQGATRSVGNLTINSPLELNAAGAVSVAALTASGLTSGTATLTPDLVFSSAGDKAINVGGLGTLSLEGDVSGTTGRILKTGEGTLMLGGSNTTGLRVGTAGSTPVDGGRVVLGQADSAGTSQIQHNFGTLETDAVGGITLANGVSIGGRTGSAAVFGGTEDLTFEGGSSFFRATGTSGELRADVNNHTEFTGAFAATSGSGSATGITFGGTGRLTLSGDASVIVETITLQDSLEFMVENTVGGNVVVGSGTTIGGNGTVGGDLSFAAGSSFLFDDPTKTLNVDGETSFSSFGITSLVGVDWDSLVLDSPYTLIGGTGTVDLAGVGNVGIANSMSVGMNGRSAYFQQGSLQLVVVPEPSTFALLGCAAVGLAIHVTRRRR